MRKLRADELNRLSAEAFKNTKKNQIAVLLDNVRSLHNVGAVFRSADAFAVEKLWLCGYTPFPPHRDIRKTALGAEDTVAWEHRKEALPLLMELKAAGWTLVAVEQCDLSIPLPDFNKEEGCKYLLIFGNEVEGVQDALVELCNVAVEIPQQGTKHSLNISVAAGIVLFGMTR